MAGTNSVRDSFVYHPATGNKGNAFVSMKRVGNLTDRELREALDIQGHLIGELKVEEVRMTAQYRLLDGELARRAQLSDAATEASPGTAAAKGTTAVKEEPADVKTSEATCASVSTGAGTSGGTAGTGQEPTEVGGTDQESGRKPRLADPGREESVDRDRGTGNRERSRSQRLLDAAAESSGTRAPREGEPPVGIREPSAHTRESSAASGCGSSPKGSAGEPGNPVAADRPRRSIRLEARQDGNHRVPVPPEETVCPHKAPLDLRGRATNASTVYVGNISRGATEQEVLELFNSVNGAYGNRQPNIVVAVNFVYDHGKFVGQAYLLYSTVELAEFAVERMHERELRKRRLYVKISDRRFNTGGLNRRGNQIGSSRGGQRIWEFPRD